MSTTETAEATERRAVQSTSEQSCDRDDGAESLNDSPQPGSCNPSMLDDDADAEQLERIKGDAIGDTLYSERFVLSTLLKLAKVQADFELANDEGLETDLCAVWDMTVEEDVVDLMMSHDVLDLFSQCLDTTQDKRLTEILVGIIGNMCNFEPARLEIAARNEVISTLLQLITCTDSLTLIQLMRLLTVALIYEDDTDVHLPWYKQIQAIPTFAQDFAYILKNSLNKTLLTHSLEALNAILASFYTINELIDAKHTDASIYTDIFVNEALIAATMEAFNALIPAEKKQSPRKKCVEKHTGSSPNESDMPTDSLRKIMQIFLNIHVIFAQSKHRCTGGKLQYLEQLLPCLSRLMEPLCELQYLLPLNTTVRDIMDNIGEIFSAFEDPFDNRCFEEIITIWHLTYLHSVSSEHKPKAANDFEADDEEELLEENACKEVMTALMTLIARIVNKTSEGDLEKALSMQEPEILNELIEFLDQIEAEELFKKCRKKLIDTYEHLSKRDNAKSVPSCTRENNESTKNENIRDVTKLLEAGEKSSREYNSSGSSENDDE